MPRVAAVSCMVLGLIDLLTVIAPPMHSRLAASLGIVPGVMVNAATATTAGAGVLLWCLALGLGRRKQRAWLLALILSSISFMVRTVAFEHLRFRAMLPMAVSALLLIVLVTFRREFYVPTASLTQRRVVWVITGTLVLSVTLGFLLVSLHERISPHGTSSLARLGAVILGLVGIPTVIDGNDSRADDFVYFALLGMGIALGVMCLYFLLRCMRRDPMHSRDAQVRVREFLERGAEPRDADSLAYFATREDRHVLWSSCGDAAISYAVVNGVMLAIGDPLGDEEAWPRALQEFCARARDLAWIPAVAACGAGALQAWSLAGNFKSMEIGDEALIDCETFTLEGRERKSVRNATSRVVRAGVVMRLERAADLEVDMRDQLRSLVGSWRRGHVERGYSMALGRFADPRDPDAIITWAERHGEVLAILQFVPWGGAGWSLDVMRRSPSSPSGTTEALIVSAIEQAGRHGIERVSLNFAPFRSALERGALPEAGHVARLHDAALKLASRWFQIASLHAFSRKFGPTWSPRYLMYPARRDLPRVTAAYLRAESFLPRPRDFGPVPVTARHFGG